MMIEVPFGSVSSVWSALPSPAFAIPGPPLMGNSAIGAPPFNPPLTAPPGISTAGQMPGPSAFSGAPYGFGVMPLAPQSVSLGGVTPASLLSIVAMRRGQPQGPTTDPEIEDFVYDAFELLPGSADVEVRAEGARVTLTGSVPHRRIKRDLGEVVWTIPNVNDVQNNVTITARRRARPAGRDTEGASSGPARKQG